MAPILLQYSSLRGPGMLHFKAVRPDNSFSCLVSAMFFPLMTGTINSHLASISWHQKVIFDLIPMGPYCYWNIWCYIFFLYGNVLQKSPWTHKSMKQVFWYNILLEELNKLLNKLRSAKHGYCNTWFTKMFWYQHLKSSNPGTYCQITVYITRKMLLTSSFGYAAVPGKLLPCVATSYLLPRTWKQNLWAYLALLLL